MRAFRLFSIIALFVLSAAAVAARPASGPQLDLQRTGVLAAAPGLAASPVAGYAIIQFAGPIATADRAALEATGAAILEYLPDFAYLVRGTPEQLDAAARVPHVYARQPFTAADKLAPALLRALAAGAGGFGALRVLPWPGQEQELGSQLRAAALRPDTPADAAALLRLAALPAARWIEPAGSPRLLNDVARKIMHVDNAWQARGLYGAGQTIAIADSGLDTGSAATLSPDFAGRLVAAHVMAQNGDLADQLGHGTHVAGSAVGAGVQSGAKPAQHSYTGSFAGVAPEAGIVIQAFETDAENHLVGLDPDYYKLFAQAYGDGARLHSDSWGDTTGPASDLAAEYGGYPSASQRTDQFVWEHPDMAIFFAAGNEGRDGTPSGEFNFCFNGDGVVDPDSLLAPGTAKNVVTVGASEGDRTSGGASQLLWVYFSKNFCLSADPIASDPVSNNASGLAAFSSRGPADDGRTKPDLVAPGTNIISNRSHDASAGALWGEYNRDYVYSGGTSMSTPMVAGAGALVRQWLTMRGIAGPSAAAVKAVLLNTTANIAPGQYGTGKYLEIPADRPNNAEGWGRADLAFLSAAPPYTLWVDDHTQGIGTGETVDYTSSAARSLDVLDSSQPLRIMLAWSDPPASLSAKRQLVNDLDLVVTGPGNTTYFGNGGSGDHLNNVEGLVIEKPAVGRYTIQVKGYNVPIKSQPYALAVGGALSNAGQLMISKSASPAVEVAPGALITYTLSLSANRAVTQAATISDALPEYTSFVSASNGGKLSNKTVKWSVAPFAAGATILRTLVVRVDADAPAGAPIVNADYHAADGADLQGDGAPVSVRVKGVAAAGGALVYVPLARR
ncbi:S8 family serine peptidase [Kouleothrix sp.]|uniref:S8 family serine peptidase n=1 Tax=Kouleothrix sp. TaxID=2779161 RepID=UPI00391CA43E